jgi:hypothetical protein
MDGNRLREVRLKPEFAEIYQDMPVGQWLPAARWAQLIVARAQQARARQVQQRTFDPGHFEFRGGEPPRGSGARLHTRAGER